MPAFTYLQDIPSLTTVDSVSFPRQQFPDDTILSGQIIDDADLVIAKNTVATLRNLQHEGVVTPNLTRMAQLRVEAINHAQLSSAFLPCHLKNEVSQLIVAIKDLVDARVVTAVDLTNALTNALVPLANSVTDALTPLANSVTKLEIESANTRIRSRNKGLGTFNPVAKVVVGDGLSLAHELCQGVFGIRFSSGVVPAKVGTTPALFNEDIDNYTNFDIANIMLFYNETFDILKEDSLEKRRERIKFYLTF